MNDIENDKKEMKYFSIKELTKSETATKKGIDNTPNAAQVKNLEALIDNLLDPIREQWGAAIYVTSGFRSVALNKAVGGVANSHHLGGYAADLTVKSQAGNKALFEMIRCSNLRWTQLISEKTTAHGCGWVHISYVPSNLKNQVLRK